MAALLLTTLPVVGLLGVLYSLASGTGLVDAITKVQPLACQQDPAAQAACCN